MATAQSKRRTSELTAEEERKFQAAVNRRSLRKPAPPIVQGNRGYPLPAFTEEELCAQTMRFFEEAEEQLAFYSEGLGQDVMWMIDWFKKYWAAWSGGVDEALVRATIAEDCEYKDPLSFGRPMVGVDLFIEYNQRFFDASPDLRYDALPGQFAIQLSPKGELTFITRYTGCGHWDHPLTMYPFTKGSRSIPATGSYVQMSPVDRYHFNEDRKLCRGETLWDPLEAMQLIGLVPSDTSLAFKSMVEAGKVAAAATRLTRRLPLIGGA